MDVNIDNVRRELMSCYAKVRKLVEDTTLEQYENNETTIEIDFLDVEEIYDAINDLRQSIDVIMCLRCPEIGMEEIWQDMFKNPRNKMIDSDVTACKEFEPNFQVKQLEWQTKLNYTMAITPVAKYSIMSHRGALCLDITHYTSKGFGGATTKEIGRFNTIEEAKATAQEHYNNLIMECIE